MAFQNSVRLFTAGGVPGDKAFDGPTRAMSGLLLTAAVIGTFMTEDPTSPGAWKVGAPTDAQHFALLVTTKDKISYGTSAGGPLAPTLTLPAKSQGTLATMGSFWVVSKVAGSKAGDVVYADNVTGEVHTAAPGASAPAGTVLVPGAVVAPLPGGTPAGLIVVTLNGGTVAAPVAP